MERLITLVVALMVYVALGVDGTAHLSFSNNTEVNITLDGCGSSKLCVAMPDNCDPAGNGTCLFASAAAVSSNSNNITFQLRGNSAGYVALGLTANASVGTTSLFICGQNVTNRMFFFRTMTRNNTNGALSAAETRVTEIRGSVSNDSVIGCEFIVLSLNASSMRSSHATTFSILLGNGTVSGDTIGEFNVRLDSGLQDLTSPTGGVTTPSPNTTATTATTATTTNLGSRSVQLDGLLLLLGLLSLLTALMD